MFACWYLWDVVHNTKGGEGSGQAHVRREEGQGPRFMVARRAIEFWRALIMFLQDPAAPPVGDRLRDSHKIQAFIQAAPHLAASMTSGNKTEAALPPPPCYSALTVHRSAFGANKVE
ncbi:hypothetical protein MRX96_032901 [Rhipicephalus microplus]